MSNICSSGVHSAWRMTRQQSGGKHFDWNTIDAISIERLVRML